MPAIEPFLTTHAPTAPWIIDLISELLSVVVNPAQRVISVWGLGLRDWVVDFAFGLWIQFLANLRFLLVVSGFGSSALLVVLNPKP